MYPVYIMKKDVQLPEAGIYYVVASNGIFLHKDMGLINAFVPVPTISFLAEVSPWATHKLPKIPVELIAQVLYFARDVFNQRQSEAVVLLYYSMDKKEYLLVCPTQEAVELRVNYQRDINVAGYRQVGTIHSHPDFSAYHSTIDENDENGFDGVHITLGNVIAPCFSISVELAVNGTRFKLAPESIIEGIRQVEFQEAENVVVVKENNEPLPASVVMPLGTNLELILAAEKVEVRTETEQPKRYQLFKDDKQLIEPVTYPKNWLKNVVKLRKEAGRFDLEEEVKNGDKGHRRRRHRLLSFALFGKVFTVSIQKQRNNKSRAH